MFCLLQLPADKLQELLNELTFLRSFRHENIVKFQGTRTEGEVLHVFLEYLPGVTLVYLFYFRGFLAVLQVSL